MDAFFFAKSFVKMQKERKKTPLSAKACTSKSFSANDWIKKYSYFGNNE